MPDPTTRDVAIVGPCASGKTTLVATLARRGIRARSVAQEHSNAPFLFRHRPADLLVFLDVSYDEVRRRRDVPWGPERLRDEAVRLREARAAADLLVMTDGLRPEKVADLVVGRLRHRPGRSRA